MRVVVLGAGFAGLELTTRLSDEFGDAADVVLIDESDAFVFGFSKLDVMFGRLAAGGGASPVSRHRQTRGPVRAVDDPVDRSRGAGASRPTPARSTPTSSWWRSAPISHPAATPGLVEGGHEFYTVDGAFALRDVLAEFDGGRVVVGVTSTPFKCPPAPSETALLMHDFLTRRGLRERSAISLVMPLGVPIPPSPAASPALLAAFEERGIDWYPERAGPRDSTRPARSPCSATGRSCRTTCSSASRVHRAPAVVEESGMTVDGWIPVDPLTLETAFPGVYAVGDVTSVGTPKAGVFAEGQAAVVAERIVATDPRRRRPQRRTTGRASATSSSATTRSRGST